ncbi:MAG: hypothetical protein Q8927_09855 [Bacteroidota bacterium]|nr:hypothetical protein [Bacteroidota bacterium]MDP4216496.1 hypothetical protein [Bacteroidota bacterium]MDP4248127.1 hypothetical protein [Bacteroidota bacterium]MDP4254741.1 hypothetical protein [Bacteroidota bacterium]MDP4260621.1 hypothetical protein [Bacteroidota bacterium]
MLSLLRTFSPTCLLAILSVGCQYARPLDTEGTEKLKDVASLPAMSGTWKATYLTYEMLGNLHYRIDSVELELHQDSTFTAKRFPDCLLNSPENKPVETALFDGAGTWSIADFGRYGVAVYLDFVQPHKTGPHYFVQFDIYLGKQFIKLDQYVGDPDAGNVLEFSKSR